jgi:hypothetical protein
MLPYIYFVAFFTPFAIMDMASNSADGSQFVAANNPTVGIAREKFLSPEIRQKLDSEFVTWYDTLENIPDKKLEGNLSLLQQKSPWFATGDRNLVDVGDI